jgi:hypothetical protein
MAELVVSPLFQKGEIDMVASTPSHEHGVSTQADLSSFVRDELTVAHLRRLVQYLPPEARVVVRVRDRHRFNVLLGELSVRAVSGTLGYAGSALVLKVDGLS